MIQPYSHLNVADNSGAKIVGCIRMMGGVKLKKGMLGDVMVASVKLALPRGTVKTHEKVKAVIVRQRSPYQRKDGSTIRFDDNAVVIINDDGTPRGTRVIGPVARELREKGYTKIISLAPEVL